MCEDSEESRSCCTYVVSDGRYDDQEKDQKEGADGGVNGNEDVVMAGRCPLAVV